MLKPARRANALADGQPQAVYRFKLIRLPSLRCCFQVLSPLHRSFSFETRSARLLLSIGSFRMKFRNRKPLTASEAFPSSATSFRMATQSFVFINNKGPRTAEHSEPILWPSILWVFRSQLHPREGFGEHSENGIERFDMLWILHTTQNVDNMNAFIEESRCSNLKTVMLCTDMTVRVTENSQKPMTLEDADPE